MTIKHTQEPWATEEGEPGTYCFYIVDSNENVAIAKVFNYMMQGVGKQNARRIVACVNACAGLDTGLLENIVDLGDSLRSRFDSFGRVERELTNERDDLQRELVQVKAAMKAQADGLVKQRDELVAALYGSANYIDRLGSDSKGYRIQISSVKGGE